MAQDSEKTTDPQHDGQLRALISLFNWLVGEVITARIMILRLAADLVRTGALPVEEVNGMPLTQEIIDSVMSNFPSDPMWQALGQRLRNSLAALRNLDLKGSISDEDDAEDEDDDDEDGHLCAVHGDDDEESEVRPEPSVQVIYRNPDHDLTAPEAAFLPHISRMAGRSQN